MYIVQKTVIPGGGWVVGDEIVFGGARRRVIGVEGLCHRGDSPPIFISEGDVRGLSRGMEILGRTTDDFECRIHYPRCVVRIRYEIVDVWPSPNSS